jgi:TPR repeat protein
MADLKGWGVAKNSDEGGRLLLDAAQAGYAPAQYTLGALILRDGGDKRRDQAVSWLRKAAAQGNADAKDALKKLGVPER